MEGAHSASSAAHAVPVLGQRDVLVVRGRREERIAAIATAQRGRVARWQLLRAGISDWAIHRMLKAARLHRRLRGVYAVGHVAWLDKGAETEALLASRWGAVLSHHSAAALWGLRPARSSREGIDVLVVGGETTKRTGIRSHRTTFLHPRDVRIRAGLPLTAPARTLLDIAPDLTPRELEWALDEALARHIMTRSQLTDALKRSQGRRGATILKALAGQRTTSTRTRSHPEEVFLRLVREAELPPPEVNIQLHGFEADFYWPNEGVVVEIDGYSWHSTKSAFERDHRKDVTFRAHGLDVSRFTADQLVAQPYMVVAAVTRRLSERSAVNS